MGRDGNFDTAGGVEAWNTHAEEYSQYLNSEESKIYQRLILDDVSQALERLPKNGRILDLGCGEGTTTRRWSDLGFDVNGVDFSDSLIDMASSQYPQIDFKVGDITQGLDFSDDYFEAVVSSMVLIYISDLKKVFENVRRVLKPDGLFVFSILNPYYAYPVGIWKRGLVGRLLGRKPRLIIRQYFEMAAYAKPLGGGNFSGQHHILSDYLNGLAETGFKLEKMVEPRLIEDGVDTPQMYRHTQVPIYLLVYARKV